VLLEQLGLVDQINMGALEAGPLLSFFVIHRVNKTLPVLLIDKVLVHAVVETRVT
jgi:hypothetical protein